MVIRNVVFRLLVMSLSTLLVATGLCLPARGDTITIIPSKDNTLIQPVKPTDPLFSNAMGSLYIGRVGTAGGLTLRRFVLAFDVAGALPKGAIITGASLRMRIDQTNGANQTIVLRRALADWGEGESFGLGAGSPATTNDATWYHTFYDTQTWTSPGGDFSEVVSASTLVGSNTMIDYIWSDPQMVADVQDWLDNPAGNFGWLARGYEGPMGFIAKGFWSSEGPDETQRPRLTIDFTPPTACVGDVDGNGSVDVDDLIAVILDWGCTNPPGPCPADVDGNGTVDVDDLIAVILNWGPC
jgi:hypothetical protein